VKAKADMRSLIYGLAAGAATVAFQLGMNGFYRLGLVQLSHLSLRTFLIGSVRENVIFFARMGQ
jgi:hypothetical protein